LLLTHLETFVHFSYILTPHSPTWQFSVQKSHLCPRMFNIDSSLFRHEFGPEVSHPSLRLHESIVSPYFQAATALYA